MTVASPRGREDPSRPRRGTLLDRTLVSGAQFEILLSCALNKIETTYWMKPGSGFILQAFTYLPLADEMLVT